MSASDNLAIEEKYPQLSNFLGAWFPDSDFEEASDQEISAQFVEVSGAAKTRLVLQECQALLQDEEYLDAIGDLANRYFENIQEAKAWLQTIKHYLEQGL